jgi:predicted RNA-binding Zn ribbon-like protein
MVFAADAEAVMSAVSAVPADGHDPEVPLDAGPRPASAREQLAGPSEPTGALTAALEGLREEVRSLRAAVSDDRSHSDAVEDLRFEMQHAQHAQASALAALQRSLDQVVAAAAAAAAAADAGTPRAADTPPD